MSPWSFKIFRTCSGGICSFSGSVYPNFLFSAYRFAFRFCHLRAVYFGRRTEKEMVSRASRLSFRFFFFFREKMHIFEGHFRQSRASFDPEISKRSATQCSAPRGNTLFDAFALFRSKLSAPFLCSRVRRRSQKRNALFGNGNTAEINERERESLCV